MDYKLKEAYSEILDTLKKHRDVCIFDIDELERKAKIHLFGVQLKEEYGLDVEPKQVQSLDDVSFGDHKKIAWFGEKYRRTVSSSVDGRQPDDELLFTVGFSTGAYIFGVGEMFDKDYPIEFFQKFWMELKTYKPDYIDENNHYLYWNIKNAKDAFNSFDDILKKYYELNREDVKQRRIKKMKEDLLKLENN